MKSIFNRLSVLATAGIMVATQAFLPAQMAYASNHKTEVDDTSVSDSDETKAYICKYVGTPGTDEHLQTGNNPISIDRKDGMVIGTLFVDAHGRSVVIGFGKPGNQQNEPTINDCPATLPTPIATPSVDIEGVCGINNDKITYKESTNYTASETEWEDSTASVTFTISQGIDKVFEDGTKAATVTKQELNTKIDCDDPADPPAYSFTPTTCTLTYATLSAEYDTRMYLYTYKLSDAEAEEIDIPSGEIVKINAESPPKTYTVSIYLIQDDEDPTPLSSEDVTVELANGCGGNGGNNPDPDVPIVPSVPNTPATPLPVAGKGVALPVELPRTGPSDTFGLRQLLLTLTAAAITYGAAYFAQPKRRYE